MDSNRIHNKYLSQQIQRKFKNRHKNRHNENTKKYHCTKISLHKTTPQQQRICMKKICFKNPTVGEYWYPIDKKWYDSWERYTMFNKGNDDIPDGIDNLHNIGEPRPGKIDNSALQGT